MDKITRFRGDTYSINVTLEKDGLGLDLRPGYNVATFSFARGTKRHTISGTSGTGNGNVSFPFPADVTAGTYLYDIQVRAVTGEIRTYIKDTLEIVSDITA